MTKVDVTVSDEPGTQSETFSLNKTDILKIGKGLGIAVAGTILTYLATIIPNLNLGDYTLFLMPIFSAGVNALLKLVKGKQ